MKIKFKVKEVRPRIFLAEFEDPYDLAMTFCRYQEFYESPNPKFRGKHFTMAEFMSWYSKEKGGGMFTYPKDWSGFNLPSKALYGCYDNIKWGNDFNVYDGAIEEIIDTIQHKIMIDEDDEGNEPFYLIGAQKGNTQTVNHEIAHGFFFLNADYRKEMLRLVKKLKPSFRKQMNDHLKDLGYTKAVFDDEIQAYLSTGVPKSFGLNLKGEEKTFEEVFEKFCGEKKGKK